MNRHRAAQLPRFAAGCLVFLLATGCPPPGGDVERTLVKSLCTLSCIGDEPEASDEITVMLPGETPLQLVWIPSGSFWMGRYNGEQPSQSSESPRHEVALSSGFWLGKYEVTKRQWQALMGTTPWAGKPFVSNDPDSPAVYLSWHDAAAFIDMLCSYTGRQFRFPSEAEWEYACRAGTMTKYYWGEDESGTDIDAYAWWFGVCDGAAELYAHPVGLKSPNVFDLFDMGGNAREWCDDDVHDTYAGAPGDGSAWVDAPRGVKRILRGGGWNDYADRCRSADRSGAVPEYRDDASGFRVAGLEEREN